MDDARAHVSTIKMLRSFHYVDEKGKDQGINGMLFAFAPELMRQSEIVHPKSLFSSAMWSESAKNGARPKPTRTSTGVKATMAV